MLQTLKHKIDTHFTGDSNLILAQIEKEMHLNIIKLYFDDINAYRGKGVDYLFRIVKGIVEQNWYRPYKVMFTDGDTMTIYLFK
jgi:hypothetical protein